MNSFVICSFVRYLRKKVRIIPNVKIVKAIILYTFLNNKEITKKQTAPENLFGAVCFFRLLN